MRYLSISICAALALIATQANAWTSFRTFYGPPCVPKEEVGFSHEMASAALDAAFEKGLGIVDATDPEMIGSRQFYLAEQLLRNYNVNLSAAKWTEVDRWFEARKRSDARKIGAEERSFMEYLKENRKRKPTLNGKTPTVAEMTGPDVVGFSASELASELARLEICPINDCIPKHRLTTEHVVAAGILTQLVKAVQFHPPAHPITPRHMSPERIQTVKAAIGRDTVLYAVDRFAAVFSYLMNQGDDRILPVSLIQFIEAVREADIRYMTAPEYQDAFKAENMPTDEIEVDPLDPDLFKAAATLLRIESFALARGDQQLTGHKLSLKSCPME